MAEITMEALEAMPSEEVEQRIADFDFRKRHGQAPCRSARALTVEISRRRRELPHEPRVIELQVEEFDALFADNEFQRLSTCDGGALRFLGFLIEEL